MPSTTMATVHHVPNFIQFLFSSKPKFDCYFAVRIEGQKNPERIGAVKLMLMAHSEVFRLELEDSELAEKKDVPIKDIHPDTFKEMLRYVYGYDTTATMGFDEADDLLYVAEKYLMKPLKDSLAARLMTLLNKDNICSLMNNPACYTHLELDSAITKILRFETDQVLASPDFLSMNSDGFLKILEQDELAVPEIELWRAAIKWGKHRADSEDEQLIRQQLSGLTRQLRPYSLSGEETLEVISSGIFVMEEVKSMCRYQFKKETIQALSEFSNETKPRKLKKNKVCSSSQLEIAMLDRTFGQQHYCYNFTLRTQTHAIELLPLECESLDLKPGVPVDSTYKVSCSTTITEWNDLDVHEPVISFRKYVKYGVKFEIPLAVDGRNITLKPDTKYSVMMMVKGDHKQWFSREKPNTKTEHLILSIDKQDEWYDFPSNKLMYKTTSEE
ncbi:kelch repeat and BTB domain-containing protein 3-like isoform X2 [Macrosteles quadrilineatus]|uniref:kelch repeat and BTB domain-containing protein 3-like isoform X2 n=1 Tax=Macrosteles quadrilineatus TaxID=74068 RepID=UPI0023E1A227|nr:kelch repeat and BTB domain-containing protein 3-like isoform X2 [Macrosteles quadrilineatus]